MATIKFKRTTGVGAPAGGLEQGELAYAQGSDKLLIGTFDLASDPEFANVAIALTGGEVSSSNSVTATIGGALETSGTMTTGTHADVGSYWEFGDDEMHRIQTTSGETDTQYIHDVRNDAWTWEFWIKLDAYPAASSGTNGAYHRILKNTRPPQHGIVGQEFNIYLGNDGRFMVFPRTDYGFWSTPIGIRTTEVVPLNTWTHVAFTNSTSGIGMRVYFNGTRDDTLIQYNSSSGSVSYGNWSNNGSSISWGPTNWSGRTSMDSYGDWNFFETSSSYNSDMYISQMRLTKARRYSGADFTADGYTMPSTWGSKAWGLGGAETVLDGSLIQPNTATEPTKIVVKETNASSANSLTLKAPTVSSDYTLTLPTANPGSTTPLLVGSDGAMSYGDVSVATVSEIGDVGGSDDPHWDSVKLLIQSNTTDGSNVFDDGSASDHTITASANLRHEADQKKFGSSSIYFDGSSDIRITESTDFDFDGAFTIEAWVYHNSSSGDDLKFIMSHGSGSGTVSGWILARQSTNKLEFIVYENDNGPTWGFATGNGDFTSDEWHHVAVSSDGTNIKLFIDGAEEASSSSLFVGSGYPDFTFSDNGDATFNVGRRWDDAGKFNGYIEDVRVTKGVSRYPSAFTKPSETFAGAPSVLANEDLLLYSSSRTKWDTAKASTVKTLIGIGEDSNVEYENVTVNNILSVNGNSSVNSSSVVTVRDRLITLGHPPTMVSGDYSVTDGVVTVTCVQPVSGTVGDNIWVDVTDSQIPTGIYSIQPGDDWTGGAVTNVAYHGGSSYGSTLKGGYYGISQQGQTVTGDNGFTFVVDQGATNQGSLFHFGHRMDSLGSRTISTNATDASGVLRNFSYNWSTVYDRTDGGDWTDNSVIMDIVATQGEEALDGVADPNWHGGSINWNDESRTYRIWIETAKALPWYNNEQVGQTIRGRRTSSSITGYYNNAGHSANHTSKPTNSQENASYGYVTGWATGGSASNGGWASIFYLTVDGWVSTGATTFKFNLSDSSITGITGQLTYSAGAITDSAVSGGGIIIPGSTQKKLQWVEDGSVSSADEWNLVGGDLKIDSGESTNTALYVGETQKVIEVDADGQSGTIDSNFSFDENTTLTGDFDFGEFS